MENLAFLGDVAEWEDSDETIEIGITVLPRYARISDLVDALTMEGCPVNFLLISIVIVCLPSISSPMELCQQLMHKFARQETRALPASRREQIQMKILETLRCWARHSSAYCDFSGPVIENILDIAKMSIASDNPTVAATGKRVKAALKVIRDDLRDIDKAQAIYRDRVVKMASLIQTRESALEELHREKLNAESVQKHSEIAENSIQEVSRQSFGKKPPPLPSSNSNGNLLASSLHASEADKSTAIIYATPEQQAQARLRTGSECSSRFEPTSRESFASISLNESRELEKALIPQNLIDDLIFEDCDLSHSGRTSPVPREEKPVEKAIIDDNSSKSPLRKSMNANNTSDAPPQQLPKSPIRTPKAQQPRSSVLKLLTVEQLSSYLTIVEYEDYMLSVRPRELVAMAWTKKALKSVHPDLGGSSNLSRVIHSTNQKIAWVAREIIDYARFFGPTSEAIEYFIRTARAALRLNNFNSFFQIIAALGLPAIRHLRAGWSHVSTKIKTLFTKYLELCSSDDNYAQYRRLLASVLQQPHIPCVQVLIKDISLLESSGPWRSGGKIDMKKAVSLRSLIASYVKIDMDSPPSAYNSIIRNERLTSFSSVKSCDPSPVPASVSNGNQTPITPINSNANSNVSNNNANNNNNGMVSSSSNGMDSGNHETIMDSFQSIPESSVAENSGHSVNSTSLMASTTPLPGEPFNDLEPSRPSFVYNCHVVREAFFYSLHEDDPNFDQEQWSRNSVIMSPSDMPKPPRGTEKKLRVGQGRLIKKLLKSIMSSGPKTTFDIEGDDEGLVMLQANILKVNADLSILWQDAKQADKIETKRLVGKLARAGLY